MVKLQQDSNGNYRARKRLPDNVREEYGRLYGARHEAKFFAPKSTKSHEAKRLFGEWLAEVEGRIAAIRAEREGTGRTLSHAEARRLAGDWYEWFVSRHAEAAQGDIEWRRDAVRDALRSAVSDEEFERLHPEELRSLDEVREAVRPVLADIGEIAQFLAVKRIILTNEARNLFLDHLYDDLDAALKRLWQFTEADYSPDEYVKRFPPKNSKGTDSGITPWELFEKWVAERKPAQGTIENWRYFFRKLGEHFSERSAASITPEEADGWIRGLIAAERSASTVKKTWLKAANTVFRWAVKRKHIPRNPFAEVEVTVPKRQKLRERSFRAPEVRTILQAASSIKHTQRPIEAAKRWVPWLCAYTGARPGEMTQLRKVDVIEADGIHALRITPEAGTVKGNAARAVPLHQHLIAQGFLKFVAQHQGGPLFYNPDRSAVENDLINRKKPRYAQVRQRLADWVRELGVGDPNISPNHAWRHTFKNIGRRARISDVVLDDICGHAPASVGAEYGEASLEDMAEALRTFPRYKLKGS
jgi:integrase